LSTVITEINLQKTPGTISGWCEIFAIIFFVIFVGEELNVFWFVRGRHEKSLRTTGLYEPVEFQSLFRSPFRNVTSSQILPCFLAIKQFNRDLCVIYIETVELILFGDNWHCQTKQQISARTPGIEGTGGLSSRCPTTIE